MKFYFPLATQFTNQGDLLINVCLAQKLSSYGEIIVDFSACPLSFKNQFISLCEGSFNIAEHRSNIRSLPFLFHFLINSKNSERHSFLVLPPGPKEWRRTRGIKSILHSICRILWVQLWKLRGGRIISLGNSLAFIKEIEPDYIAKIQLLQIDYFGLRNLEDVDICEKHGIKNSFYFPDLAFFGKCNLLHQKLVKFDSKRIIFSFRRDDSLNDKAMGYLVTALLKTSPLTNPIDFQFASQTEEDFKVAMYYIKNTDYFSSKIIDATIQNSQLHPYSNAELVVSNRLHVCMVAMLLDVPFLFLSGSQHFRKTQSILESVDLSHLCYPLENITDPKFAALLNNILESKNTAFSKVFQCQTHIGDSRLAAIFDEIDSES